MAARQQYDTPTGTTAHRTCARGQRCSSKTRGEDGEWTPMLTSQPLCPADADAMAACLASLRACYDRLGLLSLFPARGARTGRVPPGSRVLVNAEADALMRLTADLLGAWASRVRSVPQLSLARHGHPHGSPEQVGKDCETLTLHRTALLALPPAPMARTWTYLPGRAPVPPPPPPVFRVRLPAADIPPPAPVPCRRCGLRVSPSPSGRFWWPAVCAHRILAPVWAGEDEKRVIVAHECRACTIRLPAAWQPPRPCRHEPSGNPPPPAIGFPAAIEDEIGDLEVLRFGDGWVTCLTAMSGEDAALDIFDRHAEAVRLLRENPAPPDWLDGVACRRCEAYALAVAPLPAGAEDPEAPAPAFSRCMECRHEMTRSDYDDWVKLNNAYARGASVKSCRRCGKGNHAECRWAACSCPAGPHPRRRSA